ncbi:energy transducer TonB [Sphingomonas sp. QA11]|uniref:energy transducer TonB n=1 Tax=Sphingomonas sp. QA11 TaxID=2950605 RepID=UPI002348F2A6|nr:energy transducer TonB [Sphingomonas sp. QA11]WCM29065.1 energy transducer TonB [Sphingomonas sp. QA11]
MIIGEGRSVTIAVVFTAVVLFLLLIVMIVLGFEQYGPRLWIALGGRVVPPPDRTLAGAKAAPVDSPGVWFEEDAYPPDAIRLGQQGRTVAKVVVDATGAPTDCTITTGSGSKSLDSTTCTILMKQATFTPARDRNGVATIGDYTVPVRWVLPQN